MLAVYLIDGLLYLSAAVTSDKYCIFGGFRWPWKIVYNVWKICHGVLRTLALWNLEKIYHGKLVINNLKHSVGFELVYMDDYIDELLHEERCCDVILPRIQVYFLIIDLKSSSLSLSLQEWCVDENLQLCNSPRKVLAFNSNIFQA